jgi:signal transduction histidine kinase/DNA-binding response OmpR family regulator/ligand-binding sensor domain-containing protein
MRPTSFMQDSRGMMWIATTSGFASFDGYEFRIFGSVEYRLSAFKIVGLAEDLHGNIWVIGFRNSRIVIDIMNPASERFMALHEYLGYPEPVEIPMREEAIVLHNFDDKIWVGTPETGYLYDGNWRLVYQATGKQRPNARWFPASDGFWRVSPDENHIFLENRTGDIIDSTSFSGSVWNDKHLNLWSYNPDAPDVFFQHSVGRKRIQIQKTHTLPVFDWINESLCYSDRDTPHRYGYTWKFSDDGIFFGRYYDRELVNLSKIFPDIGIFNVLFVDKSGGIWILSDKKIVRLVENRTTGFETYLSDKKDPVSTRGIARIGHNVLVNTYRGNYRINLDDNTISTFGKSWKQGLSLLQETNGYWVGGHSGLLARVNERDQAVFYSFNRLTDVFTIHQSQSELLTGTSNGLYRINTFSQTVEPTKLQGTGVHFIHENREGLWACTTNGLYQIDHAGEIVGHYLQPGHDLPYEQIEHLHEDRQGVFWIATKGCGLIRWVPGAGNWKQFTTEDGLSNNDIHAIYEDERGHLWLSSNYGLMRFYKDSGNVQAFFKRDGVADSEFNALSHFQATDGRIYFGGVNGITAFYPQDIPEYNQSSPPLQLTEIRTFNIKNGSFINKLHIALKGNTVEVNGDDDYLDIRVSPLVYEDANQIRYAWKLEGYSDNWIQQQSPLIRLHNLPYGSFNLRIRYTIQGSTWSEHEVLIPLHLSRPFYLRWPFLLLLALVMVTSAWGISVWRTRKLKSENQQLEREVQKRTHKIERQANELRKLDEMKSRFFSNVTHELRTPLTLILGPAETILKESPGKDKISDYVQTIRRNGLKLLNLVEELLDLSKMEANQMTVQEKPVNLHYFLGQSIAGFRQYAEYRGINIRLEYNCPNTLTILMDIKKWEKIMNNLIQNALKFTPKGGDIVVRAYISNADIIVVVEDTGQGIHPDDLPFVFDRYFQSKISESSLQGGAGIGLSLCKEYMKLFGGDISVKSTVGEGSIFTIHFPPQIVSGYVPDENPPYTLPATAANRSEANSENSKKHTLLLVEDDMDMSEYIQGILSGEYNLFVADNGKKALEILDRYQIDIVLSDLMMPEMDGLQLLKEAKERFHDLPFIMLTARTDAPDKLSALRLGVDDYLAKPFLTEELVTRLRNLVQRYYNRKNSASLVEDPESAISYDQKWLTQLEQMAIYNIHNTDFSLDSLAESLHMSRRNLYNKVMACTGMTPNQYLTEIRLVKARILLESKSFQTVAEVCYAVGMKTPHYFSKLMKDRFGKAPSEFM